MNDLKKPTSLIAGSNIIFSVGSFLYLYKKLEQLESDNKALKKDMMTLATKLNKFGNEDLQTEELFKEMNKKVSNLKREVGKVDEYEEDLKSIKDALAENDIDIKYSKSKKHKKKRYVSSEESSEYEESPKKKNKKKKEDLGDEDLINMLKQKR